MSANHCLCGNASGGSCRVPVPCPHARVVFAANGADVRWNCHGCGAAGIGDLPENIEDPRLVIIDGVRVPFETESVGEDPAERRYKCTRCRGSFVVNLRSTGDRTLFERVRDHLILCKLMANGPFEDPDIIDFLESIDGHLKCIDDLLFRKWGGE